MNFIQTPIEGLTLIERLPYQDHRGSFTRLFCQEELAQAGIENHIAQINLSHTQGKGTVRGMHFQHPPYAETKIISCVNGAIFDVAIDLRRNSPTFLHWHAERLTGTNFKALVIPPGFAHGFQTLEDDCTLLYLHSRPYCPSHEGGFHCGDPRAAVAWPASAVNLSDRDQNLPFLAHEFEGFQF